MEDLLIYPLSSLEITDFTTMYTFSYNRENKREMLLLLTIDNFLPVGCGLNTFKSMAAFVVFSYSQSQWQLYVPSSLSVTLNIERINSFLHLV